MSTDEKIVQVLEALQEGQKALQADVASIKAVQQKQGKHIEGLVDVQQKQGEQLEQQGTQLLVLQADVKTLNGKVDTVELKVETIHEYQKKAHTEIMDSLFESNEINGHVLLIVTINVVFPPGLLSPNAATYCSSRKREKTPLTHNVTCLLAVTGRVFSSVSHLSNLVLRHVPWIENSN